MTKVEFLGARLEKEIVAMVENTAKEEHIDKTKALKELIILGRKKYQLKKHLELYRKGKCSIDKAAEKTGLTVAEMMQEAAREGIRSEQTLAEYREGLNLLLEK